MDSPEDIALADKMNAAKQKIIAELAKLIVGQDEVVHQVLLTLFVGGNSLIVGVPGLAKTLLIRPPEAQLDRFMFHIVIQHPPENEEYDVVRTTTAVLDPKFQRPVSGPELIAFQTLVRRVPVAEPVMRYALHLVRNSRPKSPQAT